VSSITNEIAEQKELSASIVNGVLHGLSVHDKHTEVLASVHENLAHVLEAITSIVNPAPDLSSLSNTLSGISNAISGVGEQVEAQGQVLSALSRRLELIEKSSRDQGQTVQRELLRLQRETSDGIEQLLAQNSGEVTEAHAVSRSFEVHGCFRDGFEQSEMLSTLQAMHDNLAESVHQNMKLVARKLEEELLKDYETFALGVAEAIDFSPILSAISKIEARAIDKGRSPSAAESSCKSVERQKWSARSAARLGTTAEMVRQSSCGTSATEEDSNISVKVSTDVATRAHEMLERALSKSNPRSSSSSAILRSSRGHLR